MGLAVTLEAVLLLGMLKAQPVLKALPLTALIDGLRAISIDGAGVGALLGPALVLVLWGAGSFALALRLFRWT